MAGVNNSFFARPYKVYSALLTQSGTNDPVATVLENTLGDVVFSRIGIGNFLVSSSGLFVENKTFIMHKSIPLDDSGYSLKSYSLTVNSFSLTTAEITSGNIDDILLLEPIEIRVYN